MVGEQDTIGRLSVQSKYDSLEGAIRNLDGAKATSFCLHSLEDFTEKKNNAKNQPLQVFESKILQY
jgi:hypothetical protein